MDEDTSDPIESSTGLNSIAGDVTAQPNKSSSLCRLASDYPPAALFAPSSRHPLRPSRRLSRLRAVASTVETSSRLSSDLNQFRPPLLLASRLPRL